LAETPPRESITYEFLQPNWLKASLADPAEAVVLRRLSELDAGCGAISQADSAPRRLRQHLPSFCMMKG